MRPNSLTRILAAAVVLLALLMGCGKSEDATNAVPEPPADAPAEAPSEPAPANATAPAPATDYGRAINALGTEPFWALQIRPEGLEISGPEIPKTKVKNPGPAVSGARAVWSSEGMEAALTAAVCQDGMSDRSYPFTAEVKWQGKTFKGCATYADGALPN